MHGPEAEILRKHNRERISRMPNYAVNLAPSGFRRPLEQNGLKSPEVLFIARDSVVHVYTGEVLKRAGFQVHAMTPWEAKNMVHNNGLPAYPLVIFSNTMYSREVTEIGKQLRRRCPASKLLLILGPDVAPANLSTFDSVLEGLDGPVALVREARRLAVSPGLEDISRNRTAGHA